MFLEGVNYLRINREPINELNVFPVPDGDTGTNMCLTLEGAAERLRDSSVPSVSGVLDTVSKVALLDARGNSGVIISQFYWGLAQALDGCEVVDARQFAVGLHAGSEAAYGIVTEPREGTMLTVLREAAEMAQEIAQSDDDIRNVVSAYLRQAETTLKKTPELLPLLREAGVVDAGGLGVVCLFRGMERALRGLEVGRSEEILAETEDFAKTPKITPYVPTKYRYCLEFFVTGDGLSRTEVAGLLAGCGDSLLVVGNEDQRTVKIHLHTNHPLDVISTGEQLGEVSRLKTDDMHSQQRQHAHKACGNNAAAFGVVAVATGAGLGAIFESLGVDQVVCGGPTNNPTVQDLSSAIAATGASDVFLLPNDKNIVLAAKQLALLTTQRTHVLETRTIPQGIAAMVAMNRSETVEVNLRRMNDAKRRVQSGHVTYAIRDSTVHGKSVREGDKLAFRERELAASGDDLEAVTAALVKAMAVSTEPEPAELVTMYYGADVTEEEAAAIGESVQEKHPELEVEVYSGGQPFFFFIVSAE